MTAQRSAAHVYKANAVLTAPRLKIIQMVYDEAVASLRKAIIHLESGDNPGFRTAILKAQSIVGELFACLNFERGGEIAENLSALYQFSIATLIDANLNRTRSSIEAVLRILSTLEEGWDSITDPGES